MSLKKALRLSTLGVLAAAVLVGTGCSLSLSSPQEERSSDLDPSVMCRTCDGQGHNPCPSCKGNGLQFISEDGGKECQTCIRRGRTTCLSCSGTGSH